MSDWRPEHEGEGRYRRKWLARAFEIAALGFMVGAVAAAAACAIGLMCLFPWGL